MFWHVVDQHLESLCASVFCLFLRLVLHRFWAMVFNQNHLYLLGDIWWFLKTIWLSWLREGGKDVIGIWWVQIRDAVKNPTMHRTAPTTKNYLAQSVNSAMVEKTMEREIRTFWKIIFYIFIQLTLVHNFTSWIELIKLLKKISSLLQFSKTFHYLIRLFFISKEYTYISSSYLSKFRYHWHVILHSEHLSPSLPSLMLTLFFLLSFFFLKGFPNFILTFILNFNFSGFTLIFIHKGFFLISFFKSNLFLFHEGNISSHTLVL